MRQEDGSYLFIGLCVLEIKTQSAFGTVSAVYLQSLNGNKFIECAAGTPLFKDSVRDPPYRSQICQHATAIVPRVLIVYSTPGGLPQKMVLVTLSEMQRHTILSLEQILAERYLPFCYSEDCPVELPNLGEDYAPVYGYAQTHQTLEQWLNIWRALADDIVQKGTATKIRRFIDLPTSFWNKCMGNVDTLRHVIRGARAKRGPDSGPGSLLWFVLIDYVLYQAFRHYQHAQIEGKLDNFYSFKQLHNDRKKIVSYRAYLTKLLDALSPANLETYFPGIRQQIDMMIGSQRRTRAVALKSDEVSQLASISTAKTLETSDSKNDVKYGLIMQFLTPESELFKKRLDVTLNHIRCKSKRKLEEKVARCNRGHCVVCC